MGPPRRFTTPTTYRRPMQRSSWLTRKPSAATRPVPTPSLRPPAAPLPPRPPTPALRGPLRRRIAARIGYLESAQRSVQRAANRWWCRSCGCLSFSQSIQSCLAAYRQVPAAAGAEASTAGRSRRPAQARRRREAPLPPRRRNTAGRALPSPGARIFRSVDCRVLSTSPTAALASFPCQRRRRSRGRCPC